MNEIYSLTILISIFSFTLSMTMTPGPNNILLMTSGLNFGYKKTLPAMIGVAIGFSVMVIIIGFGMAKVFEQYPYIYKVMKIIGIVYLLYLAYKIATAKSEVKVSNENKSKPFSFVQLVLFQWMNPKAWIMSTTALTTFVNNEQNILFQVYTIAFIYLLSGIISTNSWTLGGVYLQKLLTNTKRVRYFNISMALFMILSIVPVLFVS